MNRTFLIDKLFNSVPKMDFIKRVTRQSYSKSVVMENREKYLSMSLEEKRKLYKCKNDYITIEKIPKWPEYFEEKNLKAIQNEIEIKEIPNEMLNSKIGVFVGDITCLEIDCIVNAANKSLLGGGGVDGAIHRAAGRLLYDECETLNGCQTSEAKITAAYNLPAKYIIHTVGPIGYNAEALQKAYINTLNIAIENKCRTIAFPCISTGIYGFPNDKASHIVARLCREFLEKNHENFDRIILCLFLQKDIDLYNRYLSIYFPMSKNSILDEMKKTSETEKEIEQTTTNKETETTEETTEKITKKIELVTEQEVKKDDQDIKDLIQPKEEVEEEPNEIKIENKQEEEKEKVAKSEINQEAGSNK